MYQAFDFHLRKYEGLGTRLVLYVLDGYSSELCAASATFVLPTLRLYSTCGAFITCVLCSLLQNLALFKACERGDASRVKELLSLGASVNYRNDARVSFRSYMYILH